MKLSHPVRACDEAIYFKFVQKSIAIGAYILRETPCFNTVMIRGGNPPFNHAVAKSKDGGDTWSNASTLPIVGTTNEGSVGRDVRAPPGQVSVSRRHVQQEWVLPWSRQHDSVCVGYDGSDARVHRTEECVAVCCRLLGLCPGAAPRREARTPAAVVRGRCHSLRSRHQACCCGAVKYNRPISVTNQISRGRSWAQISCTNG